MIETEPATAPVPAVAAATAAQPVRSDRAAIARKIVLGLMVFGAALRILRYAANRSLWLDECYLANSILTFSFRQLLTQPLMHWQAAPAGFLLLQKLAVTLSGNGEYALRLVPLLAGLASIPLFYGCIRRWLEPLAQALAMALFATLDPLIYYSAEAKQYGLDVTFALAILLVAMRWREQPARLGRLLLLSGTGVVAIFCSHPSVFILASAGLVLMGETLQSRRWGQAGWLAVVGGVWLAAFAANYQLFLRPLLHHPGLAAYWAADYMPYNGVEAAKWLGLELYALYRNYATMWLPLVDTAILATIIGIAGFWRRDRRKLALLILPLLLTLGAAAIHAYPFGNRLILFLVPLLLILIAAGCAVIWESFVPGRRFVAVLIVGSVLLPTMLRAAFFAIVPPGREEIKPVLAYIRDHRKPGDSLYVFYISEVPFRYYESRFSLEPNRYQLDDMPLILGDSGERDPSLYRADLARLRGKGRVWVLITHPRALNGIDEEQLFPAILNAWGQKLDRVEAFNASATLYQLDPASR